MAAAEARAAWQRTANRCFVQEDAKRAPKLACSPSPSCARQYDSSNNNATNGHDHPTPNFMPLNWNPTNSNFPPDTRWWLQLQPNFGYQKCFTCEQLKAMDDKLDEPKFENTTFSKSGEAWLGNSMDIDSKSNDYLCESPWLVSAAFLKHDSDSRVEGMKTIASDPHQTLKRKVDTGEYFYHDEGLMDWKSVDELFPKKPEKGFPDLGIPPVSVNKSEPWWRVADKDELASFVAQRSQQHIENCDLPRPSQISRVPFTSLKVMDSKKRFSSCVGRKLNAGICNPLATSGSTDANYRVSLEQSSISASGTEGLCSGTHAFSKTIKDPTESMEILEGDPSRAQLLEALRRSQTRAREAEMVAQEAYNEKEHIVSLLFRQASLLFAYKQWLRILQLEKLCLQLKIKDHQIPLLFPVLPWRPLKGKPSKKGEECKACNICKYAVLFAVGLGLAGAGLLLGWTLGWLLQNA